jgi:hypothetical protein
VYRGNRRRRYKAPRESTLEKTIRASDAKEEGVGNPLKKRTDTRIKSRPTMFKKNDQGNSTILLGWGFRYGAGLLVSLYAASHYA